MTENLRVDISTRCQLRCPSCPTAQGLTAQRLGSGFMGVERFRELMRANPRVHAVDLANWGESLLAPELPQILRYAFAEGIALSINGGANLNHLPETLAEDLVRYRLRGLNVAIDGASAETYARYRVGGDFERVLANVRRLNAWKRSLRSDFPRLRWQFIAFRHNVHEIEAARELAAKLGMDFHVKLSWDEALAPDMDAATFERLSGVAAPSRSGFAARTGRAYSVERTCFQLWTQPKVNWNGEVYGCTWNDWASYGNAYETSLEKVLASERYAYAQLMVQGLAPERADVPCSSCSKYAEMRRLNAWVDAPAGGAPPTARFGRWRNRASNWVHALRCRR